MADRITHDATYSGSTDRCNCVWSLVGLISTDRYTTVGEKDQAEPKSGWICFVFSFRIGVEEVVWLQSTNEVLSTWAQVQPGISIENEVGNARVATTSKDRVPSQ